VLSQDQTLQKKLCHFNEEDDSLMISLKLFRVSLIGCPCCLVFKDQDIFFCCLGPELYLSIFNSCCQ
ncbi:hypothetical protein, partial [Desulfosporosinus nitroreducens]|uniref:hypothetical protein n=1 Tax=Desulfosporosinus nitroreducens TaxID=2018668 RepID=UPI00207C17D2